MVALYRYFPFYNYIFQIHYMYIVKILNNCKSLHHLTYYLILFLVFILDINLLNSLIIFNVRQKYFAICHIFNSLLSIWKCDHPQPFMFDILLENILGKTKERYFKKQNTVTSILTCSTAVMDSDHPENV